MDRQYMETETKQQACGNVAGLGTLRGPENGLRSSIRCHLEDAIKRHRDAAYRLETFLRELPALSHESDRVIWDLLVEQPR